MKIFDDYHFSSPQTIFLLGYRGAGKSTIATQLGKIIKLPVCSTDKWIEEAYNGSTQSLIAEHGWKYFRKEEVRAVNTLLKKETVILDGGGGIIENIKLMDKLVGQVIFVYIKTSFKTLLSRLTTQPRPKLTALDTLEAETKFKLAERIPLYEKYADITVTNYRSPARTVQTLVHKLVQEKRIEKSLKSTKKNKAS